MKAFLLVTICILSSTFAASAHADPSTATAIAPDAPMRPDDSSAKERNFYQVLEDVLGDFEYDLKNGNVTGLKDLAIRNIALSENVPPSFKNHLELLITEKIMKNTKTRMVQCLQCKSKRTMLNGDQVVITSPDTNPAELQRIAKLNGILNFMDVSFSYQPNGMILSMYITDADSGSVVWSHSYNSESSRAAAFRRGADYSQNDEARRSAEYIPTIQYRPTVYYMSEPNVGQTTGCLGFGFRAMERYDNRKKEVGFELDYFLASASIAGGTPAATAASPTNLWTGFNTTLLFVHAWNLIGEEENFNKMRGSLALAIGGTYASGFLGALIRASYDWRMGKHFAVSANLGYRPQATPFVGGVPASTVSGVEFGLGVSALF